MYGVVYKITCNTTKRVYIGQTSNFETRKRNHIEGLESNTHSNPFLQEEFNRFGINDFTFDIIEECETLEQNLERETFWMNYYGGIESNLIYNVKDKYGDNKDYVKRKTKKFKPDAFKGHKHSDVSKSKISESLKETYRQGNRAVVTAGKFGADNNFYGKHHTEETKQILSKQHLGKRKYSADLIDNIIDKFNDGLGYDELNAIYKIPTSTLVYLIHHKQDYIDYGLANKYKSNKV